MNHIRNISFYFKPITFSILFLCFISYNALASGQMRGGQSENVAAIVGKLPFEEVSQDEREALFFMIQEEKLARDVYALLYKKWNLPIFGNITKSEQTHVDAIQAILSKYQLKDPTQTTAAGEFNNDELKELYEDLTAKGDISLLSALVVGATIEDLDIKDLEESLSKTDNQDIRMVYQNLMKGSRNHIRSFNRQILKEGEVYQAQFISNEKLKQILDSPHERHILDGDGQVFKN